MNNFNAKKVTEDLIYWIKDWFNKNGKDCKAVIGISGGKDSSVVAALCVAALGKDRVFGVLMPCGTQNDISSSFDLISHLEIDYCIINILDAVSAIENGIKNEFNQELTDQASTNLPARVRMSTLYAVSQMVNGRVANTCNLSEDWVGYAAKYGDGAGDFSPLSKFTVAEVKTIGRELGLPNKLIDKTPIDGLCGKTDEYNLGFSYDVLDRYIRTGEIDDLNIKNKIDSMHEKNLFKLLPMPCFEYKGE